MRRVRWPETTLVSRFALLSLLAIAVITGAQVLVQWWILRADLLDWEKMHTASVVQTQAGVLLRPDDFARWEATDARERFEDFFRASLFDPAISGVRLYDVTRRVVWADDPRLVGVLVDGDPAVARALRGEVVASMRRRKRIDLYVPLMFARGSTPGTATIMGVVHVAKDPARLLANLERDRWTIFVTSVAGAAVLYTALFGLVLRASRQLDAQRRGLERQAAALAEARRDLRATQDQLRASERLAAIGEVSAGVAHGIRNPLANIRASAEVALDAGDDRTLVEKYLGTVMSEVDRLDRWLTSLLNVVRPFEPRLLTVQPNDVVTALAALFEERCAERGVALRVLLAPSLSPVAADPPQLEQALSTIVENALEVLGTGGALTLSTAAVTGPAGPGVRISVQDDGPGIPRDVLPRVLEPFFTTKARGTGLGLAVARRIVEAHGGRIAVESEAGVGTTVSITLDAR